MALSIRPATPEDAAIILAMSRTFAEDVGDTPSALTEEVFRRDGFGPEAWFQAFLAETGEGPAGYAIINRAFDPLTASRGLFLTDLYVAADRRSQGIGLAIMRYLARYARALDGQWIVWDVPDEGSRAQAFYRSLGAEPREKLFELSTMILQVDALEALAASDPSGESA